MPRISCPKCGTTVDAEPGRDVTCPSCAFTAPYGPAAGTPAASAPAATPEPLPSFAERIQSDEGTPSNSPAPWGYLLGVLGLITFWAADLLIPFLLGAGAIVLGVMGRTKSPDDKRSWPAIGLGSLAIVAAGVFLFV